MKQKDYILLTLEQLQKMDKQTVLIGDIQGNITDKGLVQVKRNFVSGESNIKYYFESFEKAWTAYFL